MMLPHSIIAASRAYCIVNKERKKHTKSPRILPARGRVWCASWSRRYRVRYPATRRSLDQPI